MSPTVRLRAAERLVRSIHTIAIVPCSSITHGHANALLGIDHVHAVVHDSPHKPAFMATTL